MRKAAVLILVVLLLICRFAAAEDELYTFAGLPADIPFEQLKDALEAATHLTFTENGASVRSAIEPPVKFLDMPVYMISGEKNEEFNIVFIDVILKPYEVDLYADQTWKLFDDGQYLQLRENIQERYGSKCKMFVTFTAQGRQDIYRIENTGELMYIVEDAATWMMRNAYESARIEIYRKNLCEGYVFTNVSDSSLYGNVGVAYVYPLFQFYPADIEAAYPLSDYMRVQPFPVTKGVIVYRNSF